VLDNQQSWCAVIDSSLSEDHLVCYGFKSNFLQGSYRSWKSMESPWI